MGQKEENKETETEKRKEKCEHPCVVLQPQAHLYCMHVYMCVYERGVHAVWLCRGV